MGGTLSRLQSDLGPCRAAAGSNTSCVVVGHGRKIADKLQADLEAVVTGQEGDVTSNIALDVFCYEADLADLVANYVLAGMPNEFCVKTLTELINIYKPRIVLLGATGLGRDVGASVAATRPTVLIADCTDFDVNWMVHLQSPARARVAVPCFTRVIKRNADRRRRLRGRA
ncbi:MULTISPECIES: hypothetical protein [unclassified Bradyrhizobium]|uniref:hypothetical protein n=1 Tax=unclassified Bradyrhizobium TaxID=2631580 RepID=UPI00247AA373|nr:MULTISPECIES: hypothetical protein [unclassified Bradyrhizobium]WGS19180.1 hypothetical protein MTX22_32760 [Bradyrhizobium sp. ISRA463]WGS26015.1 hypothetical protein MTX19_30290 [Bradyrhizobium sp. ISRA464]